MAALVREGDAIREQLERGDYRVSHSLAYLERQLPATASAPNALADLGGRMVEIGLWDRLKGMEETKHLIERRVIFLCRNRSWRHATRFPPPKPSCCSGRPVRAGSRRARRPASRITAADSMCVQPFLSICDRLVRPLATDRTTWDANGAPHPLDLALQASAVQAAQRREEELGRGLTRDETLELLARLVQGRP